jgi:hypothetical protein
VRLGGDMTAAFGVPLGSIGAGVGAGAGRSAGAANDRL